MNISYLMQEGGPDVRQKPLTGPANHVWQVCKELQRLGHRDTLLVNYDQQILKSENLVDFEPVRVHSMEAFPIRWMESLIRGTQSRLGLPYFNLFDSFRFALACKQELSDSDLFYERMGWMGYGGGIAAKMMGIPLVLEANNGDYVTELKLLGVIPRGLQLKIALWLMRRAVARATRIIASGEGHMHRFIEYWRVPEDEIRVIENGTELVELLRRDQLKPFNPPTLSQEITRLVFVGSFEPWHGISILLNAMAKAIEQGIALELDLIGSGSELENVKKLVRGLGLRSVVNLTGRLDVNEMIPYLTRADIGVSPYCEWMEYSGLKLFDYKAAGLAIIASGEDGQPYTLRPGETAIIVEPCDADALCRALIHLATNPQLRLEMGAKARGEAEESHTWRHTAKNIECVFNQVLQSHHE